MEKLLEHKTDYSFLAQLFSYPDYNLVQILEEFKDYISGQTFLNKEIINEVELHLQLSLNQQQEYYLKTFDVQAVCYLDLGYVLFGEDYKRAQLLVNLQAEHQKAGVDCGTELADHLPNVLKLIEATSDRELARELGFVVLVPAIRFMILKFGESENFYKTILTALLEVLKNDFNGEGLEDCIIPEQAFDIKNDCLIASPKSVVCETMCHKNKKY